MMLANRWFVISLSDWTFRFYLHGRVLGKPSGELIMEFPHRP
jgi:hypothetical protein